MIWCIVYRQERRLYSCRIATLAQVDGFWYGGRIEFALMRWFSRYLENIALDCVGIGLTNGAPSPTYLFDSPDRGRK